MSMQSLMLPISLAALIAARTICIAPVRADAQLLGTEVPSAPSISERKLDAAATALVLVTRLKHDYRQQIAGAAASDRQRITDEANSALEKVVTDEGLSVEEFTTIIIVARHNAGLRAKLLHRLPSIS
jgi:hypothetical protein